MTPDEIILLSELTIIIPTWNQPLELERAIEYWRDTPVKVHILDGSEKPWFALGLIKETQNITYHHIPAMRDQNPTESFFQRIIFGLKLPTTEFSAFGCDDDFYTISGLIKSLKKLNSEPNFEAVAGAVLTYEGRKKLYWHFKYFPKIGRTDLETTSIEKKLATPSSWFLYAICRTKIWQKFLLISYEEKAFTKKNFFSHEWMMILLSKTMFKTKYINSVQLVRRDNLIGKNKGPEIPWETFILDCQNAEIINEIAKQLANGFNEVTPKTQHFTNMQLARDLIRLEQERAEKFRTPQQNSKTFKSVVGNVLFSLLPGLKMFSDRPRRLKYLWRIPQYNFSSEDRREIIEIEKLLLKPREELRLRADI